jgi:hypothetical protein
VLDNPRCRHDHQQVHVSAWSTVALSLGSAGIGATAALTGTTMQLRNAQATRDRAERAAWRERAGGVLGPIRGVLDDMEPGAIAEHGGRIPQTIDNIGRRWWRARDDLLVFGAANPSQEIATASDALAEAVARSWTSMTSLNRALQDARQSRTAIDAALLERARHDHEQAKALVHALDELSRAGR